MHKIIGEEFSPCPYFDLDTEYNLQQTLATLIKEKQILSAHDVSEGGLFTTLLESAFTNNLGFKVIQNDDSIRKDAFWFGEAQSRVVVSVSQSNVVDFTTALNGKDIPFINLGEVTSSAITINGESWDSIGFWKDKYDNVIGEYMG